MGHGEGGPRTGVLAVAYAPEGKTLASGGTDGIIRLWDVGQEKPAPRALAPGYSIRVSSLTFAPAGSAVVVGEADGSARVMEKDRGLFVERARLQEAKTAAFAPDGQTLAVAESRAVRLWRLREGRLTEHDSLSSPETTTQLAFSPDGGSLAIGAASGKVLLWRLTGQQRALAGPTSPVSSLTFSADGAKLTVLHVDQRIALWDTVRGSKLGSAQPAKDVSVLACLPDGATLVTSDLRLWQLTGDKLIEYGRVVPGAHSEVVAAFAPGGKLLASAGSGGRLYVWDVVGKKKLHSWSLPGQIRQVAFTPDGKHVATVNANGTGYLLRLSLSDR